MNAAITHRPHGIEHPYAHSADQRVPVLPLAGTTCRLGVVADPSVVAVRCEWDGQVLPMLPASADAADAAALAGGEGHLAEAQAGMLAADGSWTVETPVLEEGRRYSYRFLAETSSGDTVTTTSYDVAPATWTSTHTGAVTGAGERLVPDSVSWLVGPDGAHRARFALALGPGDHVVGFGERFDRLDQLGHRLDAVVFEQYKSQGRHGRTYLPMPFAHVVGADGSAWGFHVRTSRRTWYDVGASTPDALVVEVDLGIGGEGVDIAVHDGTPTEVLREFLDEVGRAEELPEWVLRLWASGNEWNTQQLVMDRMDTHRDLDIPVGVVVIEAWSDEEGITIFRDARYEPHPDGRAHEAADFTYPADGAWPDPRGMVDELHARGVKVILWQIPLQKTDPELTGQVRMDAAAMVREGHAVLEADGSAYHNRGWWFPQALMPDLSVQRTRDWWTEKRRYLLSDLDVDGFKTDGGEHAWGHDLRYADGRRGDEGNNLFPVHYARTFGDLLRSEGKAPVTFSRAGFTGSQAHGVFWAGDEDSTWEAFRSSVTAGLTAAACGIVYWGWDLAGFSGPVPDAELYLRAAAASVFMPVMQYHSEFNHHRPPLRDRTPWNVQEASGDERVVPVFRRLAQLRERLVPYLAEQARVAVTTDRPLMRPLFFDHPADPQVWAHPQQWQLGDSLLVSPVTEPGAAAWPTYLPAGAWVDAWTGTPYDGGAVVTTDVPIDVVPVFVRAEDWPALEEVFAG
ncbi:glycoside hydrolase family 31 protein [Nocardioides sp. T2.26MG-1]|uniref:glycoside hydrolase family 31 protein n=1 Tax=Nocardioides sp. T2.26MG-1 TaxID=3041166 RepID=UPI0024776719|nr:TIM-barrel domain-containing protein [Nocardioides sp. T2.26MG-1]CAI9403183.1 1,3-alpha-isomaltosidase [Nocardioides sp. T2.26MG-1]